MTATLDPATAAAIRRAEESWTDCHEVRLDRLTPGVRKNFVDTVIDLVDRAIITERTALHWLSAVRLTRDAGALEDAVRYRAKVRQYNDGDGSPLDDLELAPSCHRRDLYDHAREHFEEQYDAAVTVLATPALTAEAIDASRDYAAELLGATR